jgi:hypothetical protein
MKTGDGRGQKPDVRSPEFGTLAFLAVHVPGRFVSFVFSWLPFRVRLLAKLAVSRLRTTADDADCRGCLSLGLSLPAAC